jgi:hypothetical protein
MRCAQTYTPNQSPWRCGGAKRPPVFPRSPWCRTPAYGWMHLVYTGGAPTRSGDRTLDHTPRSREDLAMETTAEDITPRLERVAAKEARLGVTFDALSAFLSRPYPEGDYQVDVSGELQPLVGDTLERSIMITITIYDAHKRVIATTDTSCLRHFRCPRAHGLSQPPSNSIRARGGNLQRWRPQCPPALPAHRDCGMAAKR